MNIEQRYQEIPDDYRREYKGYVFVKKEDFSYNGFHFADRARAGVDPFWKQGIVVTNGGIINVMPGATWFLNEACAERAVDVLIETGGGKQFWDAIHADPLFKDETAARVKPTQD